MTIRVSVHKTHDTHIMDYIHIPHTILLCDLMFWERKVWKQEETAKCDHYLKIINLIILPSVLFCNSTTPSPIPMTDRTLLQIQRINKN